MDREMVLYGVKALEEMGNIAAFYTARNTPVWKYGRDGALENCSLLLSKLGISAGDMVMAEQEHTNKVRTVSRKDGGDMVLRGSPVGAYDGMVTDEKGLLLATVEADCVPVYLYDPLRQAIGMVHSGWRGTVEQIAPNAVSRMAAEYGSRPEDIVAVFGPCICAECYEVGTELIDIFSAQYSKEELNSIFLEDLSFARQEKGAKVHLDIRSAIRISLLQSGLTEDNIKDVGRCTKESPELCSWRRDQPLRQSMLTGIMML
ncbi:MAG: peptidoglycan editing factor PgeF [Lachnospiraceae bacterium]|nr:peptidoglycan editing factor PgeF [Lachnospiraceae bacterium]